MHIYPDIIHIYLILATLSLVGGTIVLAIWWLTKRNPPNEVWWMALSNNGLSVCYLSIPLLTNFVQTESMACTGQAVAFSFYSISTWSWYFLLAVRLYFVSLEEEQQPSFLRHLLTPFWSHLYVWSLSLVLSLIPLITQEYGFIEINCWIRAPSSYALVLIITPLMAYFPFIGYVTWHLLRKNYSGKDFIATSQIIIRRLFIWSIIFVIAWIWELIQSVWEVFSTLGTEVDVAVPTIIKILSCLGAGTGFYNCILWIQDLIWKWLVNMNQKPTHVQTLTCSTEEGSWTVSASKTEDSNLYNPVNVQYSTFEAV